MSVRPALLGPGSDIAHAQPVIDCHSDVMMDVFRRRSAGERSVLASVHLPNLAEGGVVAAVCTVGGDGSALSPLGVDRPYESAVAMLDALHADAAESDGLIEVVYTAAEISAATDRGGFAIVPAIEGASPCQGNLELLEEFYHRGVRVIGLTWNSRNEFAVGINTGEGGLTDAGAHAIEVMNRLGIVIDLAHASPTTFWDVVSITKAPVYVSHANAKAVWDHPRNLDDAQLDAISRSRGAVGLVLCSLFIGPSPVSIDGLLAHLEYLRDKVTSESIVIGADFLDFPVAGLDIDRAAHANLYMNYDNERRHPIGLETVRSMQNLVAAMPPRGFDSGAIKEIAMQNFLRLLRTTQDLTAPAPPDAIDPA